MDPLPLSVAVVSLSTGGSGVVLLVRRRAVVPAVLLVAGGVAGLVAAVLHAAGNDAPASVVSVAFGSLLLPAALVTFPDARWRHPADFVALVVVVGAGVLAVPGAADAEVMGLVQVCALVAHTWWRIEVADGATRRALLWMALATAGAGLLYGFASFAADGSRTTTVDEVGLVLFAVVGPALVVGATLPEVVDVRGLVVTAVVAVVALLTVMSLFVLGLSLLAALGEADPSAGALGLLAALVAMAFHPTRTALRGVVDRVLFGDRPDPLDAASAMADRIGDDPVRALRAIREGLVLPYAALEADGAPPVASGTPTSHTRTFDLAGVGRLVVGLRPGDLSFSAGDEQVLRLTAPLLAQTLRARSLAAEVLDSRGRTVAAVEEERRRLRRDLHDGLGPRLSGVAFTSDAARNLIRTDPAAAEELVSRLRADTVTAIEEIRRMVYAMRPPALDELGLVPALRQQARSLRGPAGEPMSVRVLAGDALPDLPAAVEVAAYRIVVEALTNVARHSTGSTAAVRLEPTGGGLRIEVTDTGGVAGPWRAGVGIASMRERAAELGGTLEAGPGPDGGRVAALLPL